jgi:hypothetical protein
MGVSTNYLGHVEIVPSLNQAEYDYLHAFACTRRSYRPDRELSLLRVEANEVTKEILAEATLFCRGSRAVKVSTTGPGWPASHRGGPAWTSRRPN